MLIKLYYVATVSLFPQYYPTIKTLLMGYHYFTSSLDLI